MKMLLLVLLILPLFASAAAEQKVHNVGEQIKIVADVTNSQDKFQPFVYIVQVQDASKAVVSLAWLTGSLSPNQQLSPALSWMPTEAGTYTATVFVWESLQNPEAISPPLSIDILVE